VAEAHGDRELEFQKLGRRTFLLLGVQGAGLALLGGWYYKLQVVDGQRHRLKADDNRVAVRLTEPMRGRILDRDGQILATNKKSFESFPRS
jgi:Cell division protein FtsI/penicillin-binding protein 2